METVILLLNLGTFHCLETFLVEWKLAFCRSTRNDKRSLETFLVEWKLVALSIAVVRLKTLKPS